MPQSHNRTVPVWLLLMLVLCILGTGLPVQAAHRSQADFVNACRANSNLSEAVCTCSAQKATRELSPDGFDLLVAVLENDEATSASLRSKLPLAQTMQAATFMTRGPSQCTKETAQ